MIICIAQTFGGREIVPRIEAILDAQKTFPPKSTKHNIPLTLALKLDERQVCRATRCNAPQLPISHTYSFPRAALDMRVYMYVSMHTCHILETIIMPHQRRQPLATRLNHQNQAINPNPAKRRRPTLSREPARPARPHRVGVITGEDWRISSSWTGWWLMCLPACLTASPSCQPATALQEHN